MLGLWQEGQSLLLSIQSSIDKVLYWGYSCTYKKTSLYKNAGPDLDKRVVDPLLTIRAMICTHQVSHPFLPNLSANKCKLFADRAAEPRAAQTCSLISYHGDKACFRASADINKLNIWLTVGKKGVGGLDPTTEKHTERTIHLYALDKATLIFGRAYLFDTSSLESGMSPKCVSPGVK